MNDCSEVSEKMGTMPCMYINHDLENYYAQIELPGVKKEDIELEVTEGGLCISGKRGEKDLSGCWMLGHPVNTDEVKASYESGLLEIVMPLKYSMSKGMKVDIE